MTDLIGKKIGVYIRLNPSNEYANKPYLWGVVRAVLPCGDITCVKLLIEHIDGSEIGRLEVVHVTERGGESIVKVLP